MVRHGVARRSTAGCPRTAQRNVRDPSVYLFVNEGNETGNLIFGLCFTMASLDVEKSPLEPEKAEEVEDKRAIGRARACGRAGRPPQLGPATAGPASWALRHHHALLLMKKEGRSRTAGEG